MRLSAFKSRKLNAHLNALKRVVSTKLKGSVNGNGLLGGRGPAQIH